LLKAWTVLRLNSHSDPSRTVLSSSSKKKNCPKMTLKTTGPKSWIVSKRIKLFGLTNLT